MTESRELTLPRRIRHIVAAVAGIFSATASGSTLLMVIAEPSFGAPRIGVPGGVSSFLEAYFVSSAVALVIAALIALPALILCGRQHLGSGIQWAVCSVIGVACSLIGLGLEASGTIYAFGLLWLFFLLPGMWVGAVAYPASKLLDKRTDSTLLAVVVPLTLIFVLGLIATTLP
jgi:hypothetical protein